MAEKLHTGPDRGGGVDGGRFFFSLVDIGGSLDRHMQESHVRPGSSGGERQTASHIGHMHIRGCGEHMSA